MTKKKIIINPWAVMIELYNKGEPKIPPGMPNSSRTKKDNEVPTKPIQNPKIKYKEPISLWFKEPNQRLICIMFKGYKALVGT
jgi:hypothetical protein